MPSRISERMYNLSMFDGLGKAQVIDYDAVKARFLWAMQISCSIQAELDQTGLRMAVTSWSDCEIHLEHGNKITLGVWEIQMITQ